jgi:SulP family sulfate permease
MNRIQVRAGEVLWRQGDPPDGLYVIESGVLRARYTFADRADCMEESMVGGTLAGELSALADLPRNATVMVEQNSVLWKLSSEYKRKLEQENPELARLFSYLVLKGEHELDTLYSVTSY